MDHFDERYATKTIGSLFPELRRKLADNIGKETLEHIKMLDKHLKRLESEHHKLGVQMEKTQSEISQLRNTHRNVTITCNKCGRPFEVTRSMMHVIEPVYARMIETSLCYHCYQNVRKLQALDAHGERIKAKMQNATYQGCHYTFDDESGDARITKLCFTRIDPDTGHVELIDLNLSIAILDDTRIAVQNKSTIDTLDELITSVKLR